MMVEELQGEIRALAREKNAVILAHNYQRGEVQDVADITGDSLGLSVEAARTDAEVIVFCGVHFMAESAAILSPDKKVVLPRLDAGCPMADMITADDVRTIRDQNPGVPIVTYVNSSAEVKALSDICCTSANAVKVTRSVGAPVVYLTPDQNLAQWVARHTDQEVRYWRGYCPTHHRLRAADVARARERYPDAPFVAHPECRPEVIDLADAVKSTSGIIEYCKTTTAETVIVGTEQGLTHRLRKDSPQKRFVAPSDQMICPNMKLTSLEDVRDALVTLDNEVTVAEGIRVRAVEALDKMLQAGRD